MLNDKYKILRSNKEFVYEFISEGPKGNIKKIVKFTPTHINNVYNLGFGDYIEDSDDIDDASRSDNKDTQKILFTVAHIVTLFSTTHPKAWVAATGSTETRTRLYQMGINSILNELKENFRIFGFIDNDWEEFRNGRAYQAFLIRIK